VPWIEQKPVEGASGILKEQFDAALQRAGRVYRIVQVMSQNPELMRDSMAFYLTLMKGPSPLSQAQRELLATVVSAELRCHY
jgi:alkylhydroperoxidase family enzyme